jgi:hypothetical protein
MKTWMPAERTAGRILRRLSNIPDALAVSLIALKSLPPSLMKSLYGSTIRSAVRSAT